MQPDFDTIIVGAGVIGLAVAREAVLANKSVLVLEQAARAGTETSSRNSEVIHAGIYYPKDSLKARFCVEGRALLYDYCASHGVKAKRIGKLIVATSRDEETKLRSIKDAAEANGIRDLEWLSPADVAQLEPEVACTGALLSPSTGIVDAGAFMLSLQGNAESLGVRFAFNAHFVSARKSEGGFVVSTADAEITCNYLYNCAGLGSHAVARAIDGYPVHVLPPKFLAKGCYCSVTGKNPFEHLIYPVPEAGALGIHATLDVGGALRFGPDITWTDTLDYQLPDNLPETFSAAVQSYWPGVSERELSPSYCGIRPKIHGPDSGFADFLIQTAGAHGISGLINLFGIESPGLTASLAIAKHVTGLSNHKENH